MLQPAMYNAINSCCCCINTVTERLVFDPAALPPANSEVSAAELARRERFVNMCRLFGSGSCGAGALLPVGCHAAAVQDARVDCG